MPEQQQEPMKVYELAKELGLDSFTLLDKLKQINIEVKSHMSSLEPSQAKAARDAILGESSKKSPATKITKKKAGASAGTAKTAATSSSASARKIVKKTSSEESVSSVEKKPSTKSASTGTAGKRKIIKRKTGAEADEATESETPISATSEDQPIATTETSEYIVDQQQLSAESEAPVSSANAEESIQTEQAPPRPSVEEYLPKHNAPGTRANIKNPAQRVVEKDELLGEFSTRRLKIVQAPTPSSSSSEAPTYRTPGGPAAGAERTVKKQLPQKSATDSKEMFQPITSYVNKETAEETRSRKNSATRNTTPEEIKVADFRKREMVFQPKRKKLPPGKIVKKTEITEMSAHKKKIKISDKIVVSDLAQRMGEKANSIIGKLLSLGITATINQTIDFDTASLIASEFGWEVENVAFNEQALFSQEAGSDDEKAQPRPPIITVMGHVDHGKTSLLDAIRNAKVASGEAGGITQHIGTYSVLVEGKPLTFLDTPGHEAFANMRSRGANVTDIVVLVVAADDSIMPQTKEAIAHATAANVPMVVAANKIDKPSANLEQIKKDLSANNVLVEEWGGQVPLVGVSALKKTGIKELLETILLQAEVLDLKANPDRSAEGVILEARMEKGRGVVADLIVRKGTLHTGDHIVVGTAFGRVKAMTNDQGKAISVVPPGFPAEIFGLNDVPSSGDIFHIVKTEEEARSVAENRKKKILEEKAAASAPKPMTLDDLMSKLPVAGQKELNIIVKADVYGSAEAIKDSIEKIQSDKVKAKILNSTVGVITENDILMAKTANAMVIGFNSKPDNKARDLAKREKIDIRHYSIIYQLLDDVRAAMENLLEPIRKETPMGKAEVKQVFTVSKLGTVAGSGVLDGKISRNAFARVTRGKEVVAEGKVVSLRRFKDDVSETIKGQECGIGVENFEAFQPGDVINVFHVEFVKQNL